MARRKTAHKSDNPQYVILKCVLHQCCSYTGYNLHISISYLICPFLDYLKILKAFQSVLPAIFISCYNLLLDFLSLNFALASIRNMREKDITPREA